MIKTAQAPLPRRTKTSRSPVAPDKDKAPGARSILRQLGPGLITGASDDDPSGIATYSQVGAHFGYGLLWVTWLSYPLMAAVQEICARIARVTGHGLASNMRNHFPRVFLYSAISLLLLANVLNLGADLGAMGAAAHLILPGDVRTYTVVFGAISVLAELFIPYEKYAKYLKWLSLSLFAYVAAAFFVHLPWRAVLLTTLRPDIQFTKEYLVALTAVLGTTISPYLFFWQAALEMEELRKAPDEGTLKHVPGQAREQFHRIRVDTYAGMALSSLVAYFIILTTAATLHAHGIHEVSTAAQAALALRPAAGRFAFLLFVCGIIATGLLAVPVLAGAAAFGIGEARRWRVGLERKPKEAARFYAAIMVATGIGISLNFFRVDPIRALYWSAVLNGLVAAPLVAMIVIMARSRRVMGTFAISGYLSAMGWITALVMFGVSIGIFLTPK